jgi:hypothetical protein
MIVLNADESHEMQRQNRLEMPVQTSGLRNIQHPESGPDPVVDVSGLEWDLNLDNMDAFFESNM